MIGEYERCPATAVRQYPQAELTWKGVKVKDIGFEPVDFIENRMAKRFWSPKQQPVSHIIDYSVSIAVAVVGCESSDVTGDEAPSGGQIICQREDSDRKPVSVETGQLGKSDVAGAAYLEVVHDI
jgi:hypothetical protein